MFFPNSVYFDKNVQDEVAGTIKLIRNEYNSVQKRAKSPDSLCYTQRVQFQTNPDESVGSKIPCLSHSKSQGNYSSLHKKEVVKEVCERLGIGKSKENLSHNVQKAIPVECTK